MLNVIIQGQPALHLYKLNNSKPDLADDYRAVLKTLPFSNSNYNYAFEDSKDSEKNELGTIVLKDRNDPQNKIKADVSYVQIDDKNIRFQVKVEKDFKYFDINFDRNAHSHNQLINNLLETLHSKLSCSISISSNGYTDIENETDYNDLKVLPEAIKKTPRIIISNGLTKKGEAMDLQQYDQPFSYSFTESNGRKLKVREIQKYQREMSAIAKALSINLQSQ